MKGKQMKIAQLNIEKLHGIYDYEIKFNKKLNILHGENGCGKTTILNIIAYIITGKISKILDYKFDRISIKYCQDEQNELEEIVLEKLKQQKLKMLYKNITKVYDIKNIDFYNDEKVKKIDDDFNCIYIPINRIYSHYEDQRYFINNYNRRRRSYFIEELDTEIEEKNEYLTKVEEIISQFYLNSNIQMEIENKNFKNALLQSLVSINKNNSIEKVNNLIKRSDLMQKINKYIEILKENELLKEKQEEEYTKFFTEIISKLKTYNEVEKINDRKLLFSLYELAKMEEIIKLSEELEESRKTIFGPLNQYESVINHFFEKNNHPKKNKIESGKLFFIDESNEKVLEIEQLSSGEKQIITFFSYLIFGINIEKPAIVIVDEPEISLHLYWQSIFIDKMLEVNKEAQYIIATHSPEIVGEYREYMVRL